MNADEKGIIEYLRGWPYSYISGKEIARKVGGKRRWEKDRGWAVPILAQMVRSGELQTDQLGHFRLAAGAMAKKRDGKHVSPQLLRILKKSGKTFEGVVIDEDEETSSSPGQPLPPKPSEDDKA